MTLFTYVDVIRHRVYAHKRSLVEKKQSHSFEMIPAESSFIITHKLLFSGEGGGKFINHLASFEEFHHVNIKVSWLGTFISFHDVS